MHQPIGAVMVVLAAATLSTASAVPSSASSDPYSSSLAFSANGTRTSAVDLAPLPSAAKIRGLRLVSGTPAWVAPGEVKDVFASCADGERRLGGGFVQPNNATENGIVLVSGFDINANRWFVRVKNDSDAPLQIQAQVTCGGATGLRQINGPAASVAPDGVKDVFADCPAGKIRLGGGFVEPNNATENGIVLVNGFDINANRWFVRVKNDSDAPLQIQAQVTCARVTGVRQVSGTAAWVAPDVVKDVFADCLPGEVRVGGGFVEPNNATENGIVLVNGFDINANRWFVRVKNDSDAPLQIQAQVTCTS